MNPYLTFVVCSFIAAVATGRALYANVRDNEFVHGISVAVFFGLASIVLPIVIAVQARPPHDRQRYD